ncbi:MAG: magnesium/cobalt transporter CorA [Ginsengibacter sp.]
MRRKKYLSLIYPFEKQITKRVLQVNPTIAPLRKEPDNTIISVYEYNAERMKLEQVEKVADCYKYLSTTGVTWINLDGLRKADIDEICTLFGIHPLIAEDIFSSGQRPKMDELNQLLFCLLNMLYFNETTGSVESEQISIVLGSNFVLSFQEDPTRDVFNPLREKIKVAGSKVRQSNSDYLFYSLIDMIVDSYFVIMEQLGEKIEDLEEDINQRPDNRTLAKINLLRKEMIFLKRNISPVREMINGILRSESALIEDRTEKYFKDIYDHIVQANELAENYRDMMINLQDLYLSNVNLKMNEVMKVMAVVTCLLAPATVIGGIFGMNFNRIPWLHNPYGFFIAVGLMLVIPVWMIWMFKKRGWF